MTGRELLIELEKSGTPDDVLGLGLAHLHETPNASAESVLNCFQANTDLQARQKGRDRVSEGTITKARQIMRAGRWIQPAASPELVNAQIWLDNQRRAIGLPPTEPVSVVAQSLDQEKQTTETEAEPARPVAATAMPPAGPVSEAKPVAKGPMPARK